MSEIKREHGTMKAYIIGFLLSLIFTFIPYYLVVNQTVTGTLLLTTILGFGVLQMIVQVTFFLHLGRGPKPNWNFFFFMATIGAILVVVGGSIVITRNLHYNMTTTDQTKKLVNDEAIYQIGGEKTGACLGQHANHQIIIKNGQVSPLHTVAQRCDTLTFTNQDSETKEITFGEHPAHKTYAGEAEYIVRSGKSKTITLSESGVYKFHDHLEPETSGDFLVTPR
jgi:cytochrome o ubiquinol oxidase subunit IV